MTRIINDAATTNAATSTTSDNSLENLDLDVFLEIMLEELQNQDPLDPMDNGELLDQLSQIREISSNDKLTETLDSVLLGQNVTTATGLIGTEVEGLTDDGRRVSGAVQRVKINDGQPTLDLAVATRAEAGDRAGDIETGRYAYEIVWEAEGTSFSVQTTVDTADLGDDFQGSIRIENLPETAVAKRVYRTDGTGAGDLQLVGVLQSGGATAFTDTLADGRRQDETLEGSRQVLQFASAVPVKLSNIDEVRTLN
ncbi:MAG: flagellar hook capping FlgD N-terminal domain-containing protein [Planctomycetota bacterium]